MQNGYFIFIVGISKWPFGLLASKDFSLFGFPNFSLWAYLMKSIPEAGRAP
jgi:hypothetical protein